MGRITRRQFLLGAGALAACGVGAAAGLSGNRWWERVVTTASEPEPVTPPSRWSVEARYYTPVVGEGTLNCADCHGTVEDFPQVLYCHEPHVGTYVKCRLCPHGCIIAEGERGECRVRENRRSRLFSMVYGNPCAVHIDPIEKKPFYHYLPTAAAFSLATAGCNLSCEYCQNWQISQFPPEETQNADLPPEDVVRYAQHYNAPVIAYTYSEPVIFYEYMLDTARLARLQGLKNVVISAGYINPDPLRELCGAVDAIKIDLKGFNEPFYQEVCGGRLGPVLEGLKVIRQEGVHLEIVNLVVPTLNDDEQELRALSRWVVEELGPDIPVHFTRFHPQYKLTHLPPTPVESLERAREAALAEGVRYAYVGNVPGHPGNHTTCPVCGKILIRREGFSVLEYHIADGTCAFCGEPIPGVWWPGEPMEVEPGPSDQ